VKAAPYLQVVMSNGPWFTAPGGACSRALLSTPAGAASGNGVCCAVAIAPDTHSATQAADAVTIGLLIVSSVICRYRLKHRASCQCAAIEAPPVLKPTPRRAGSENKIRKQNGRDEPGHAKVRNAADVARSGVH
jgi:hypothetical protein